jgi:hypothetical protein
MPTDRDEDDDAQRKSTTGRVERVTIPGVPSRHLPTTQPVRLRPAADVDAHTPPEPWTEQGRKRRTQMGVAPPAPQSAPMPPRAAAVPPGPAQSSTPPQTVAVTVSSPPPRSLSPSPDGSSVQASVEIAGTRVDFRTKNPGALGRVVWTVIVSALGLGGGAAGAALTRRSDPPPPVDPTTDPCPPNQPATAKTPLCLRLQAAEGAVNSMAWDVEDLKKKVAHEHEARVDLEGQLSDLKKGTPRIVGDPKK